MKNMTPQVAKSYYFGSNYIAPGRFASYAYQLSEILKLKPTNVLEIGIGNGLVAYMLRKAGVDVTTLDFDKSLEPHIVASVTDMPIDNKSFDVVGCFEVLEHIPFEHFRGALKEIRRISRRYAILSLPDGRPCFRLYLPKIGRRFFLWDWPLLRPAHHKFDGEHYWEINKRGYNLKDITALIEKSGFSIEKTYRVWELPLNRLFRLRKVKGK